MIHYCCIYYTYMTVYYIKHYHIISALNAFLLLITDIMVYIYVN